MIFDGATGALTISGTINLTGGESVISPTWEYTIRDATPEQGQWRLYQTSGSQGTDTWDFIGDIGTSGEVWFHKNDNNGVLRSNYFTSLIVDDAFKIYQESNTYGIYQVTGAAVLDSTSEWYEIPCKIIEQGSTPVHTNTGVVVVTMGYALSGADGPAGPAGIAGEPPYSYSFIYDNLDHWGNGTDDGAYQFVNDYITGTTGYDTDPNTLYVATDFSTAEGLVINTVSTDAVDHSDYYSSFVVGDGITFYVSADRWYYYKIKTIDATVLASKVHFELEFISENILATEVAITTGEGDLDVNFRFTKAAAGADNQDFPFLSDNTSDLLGTTTNAGLHMASNYLGFHETITSGMDQAAVNATFGSYMDSSGNFYLGGTQAPTTGDYGWLSWAASTNTLQIKGDLQVATSFTSYALTPPQAKIVLARHAYTGTQTAANFGTMNTKTDGAGTMGTAGTSQGWVHNRLYHAGYEDIQVSGYYNVQGLITMEECRAFDIVVIDWYVWGNVQADYDFAKTLMDDGQRVLIYGNNGGMTNSWYYTGASVAGSGGDTYTIFRRNGTQHPIMAECPFTGTATDSSAYPALEGFIEGVTPLALGATDSGTTPDTTLGVIVKDDTSGGIVINWNESNGDLTGGTVLFRSILYLQGFITDTNDGMGTQGSLSAGVVINSGGVTIGSGGSVKGGQTAYNTGEGFFLGYDTDGYKFSIGDSPIFYWEGYVDIKAGEGDAVSTDYDGGIKHIFDATAGDCVIYVKAGDFEGLVMR